MMMRGWKESLDKKMGKFPRKVLIGVNVWPGP